MKAGVDERGDTSTNSTQALVGTLRAAKKQGVIEFKGQMLLKGAHDAVPIYLLQPLEE